MCKYCQTPFFKQFLWNIFKYIASMHQDYKEMFLSYKNTNFILSAYNLRRKQLLELLLLYVSIII